MGETCVRLAWLANTGNGAVCDGAKFRYKSLNNEINAAYYSNHGKYSFGSVIFEYSRIFEQFVSTLVRADSILSTGKELNAGQLSFGPQSIVSACLQSVEALACGAEIRGGVLMSLSVSLVVEWRKLFGDVVIFSRVPDTAGSRAGRVQVCKTQTRGSYRNSCRTQVVAHRFAHKLQVGRPWGHLDDNSIACDLLGHSLTKTFVLIFDNCKLLHFSWGAESTTWRGWWNLLWCRNDSSSADMIFPTKMNRKWVVPRVVYLLCIPFHAQRGCGDDEKIDHASGRSEK